MKDIEAMKTKMLREIALAEFSNQMEATIGNPEIGVTAFDGIGKGAKRWVSIKQNNNYKPLTMKQAGEVLCKIARTGDTDVKGATRYSASTTILTCDVEHKHHKGVHEMLITYKNGTKMIMQTTSAQVANHN